MIDTGSGRKADSTHTESEIVYCGGAGSQSLMPIEHSCRWASSGYVLPVQWSAVSSMFIIPPSGIYRRCCYTRLGLGGALYMA
jgi:hypothetical protein